MPKEDFIRVDSVFCHLDYWLDYNPAIRLIDHVAIDPVFCVIDKEIKGQGFRKLNRSISKNISE